MAYDKDLGIVSAPVGIADVQHALGSARSDLATLCSSQYINPMAKYKPVRYNKIDALTDAERLSTRYGMGATVPSYAANNANPSNIVWTYEKVRVNTDWSRLTDFNGYFHRACVPFAFEVSGALQDGVGFQLYVNSSAGNYYQEHEGSSNRWDESLNLSLAELLAGATNAAANGYIGFIIFDLTEGDNVVVVTNKKLIELPSTVYTIVLYGEQRQAGGMTYPAVSMLNEPMRAGHTFRFVCAIFNSGATGQDAYAIKPNNMDVYSLAIREGVDRRDLQLYSNYTIMGLTFTLSLYTGVMTKLGTKTIDGITYFEYKLQINVRGTFITPSAHWAVNEVGIMLTVRSDYGYVGSVSDRQVEINTAVSLPNAGDSYTYTLTSQNDIRVYIYQQVPQSERSVVISGYAYRTFEKVSAENTLKIRATD